MWVELSLLNKIYKQIYTSFSWGLLRQVLIILLNDTSSNRVHPYTFIHAAVDRSLIFINKCLKWHNSTLLTLEKEIIQETINFMQCASDNIINPYSKKEYTNYFLPTQGSIVSLAYATMGNESICKTELKFIGGNISKYRKLNI